MLHSSFAILIDVLVDFSMLALKNLHKPYGIFTQMMVLTFILALIQVRNSAKERILVKDYVEERQSILATVGHSPENQADRPESKSMVRLPPLHFFINETEIQRVYAPAPSIHEQRTGEQLPDWAVRYSFLPPLNKSASGEKSVCFVHVGKTSGSTLACYLGFRYDCGETMLLPKSRLLAQTEHLIHNMINDCPYDDDYYLFSLRDPIARIRSWFTYERPLPEDMEYPTENFYIRKPLFIDCAFHTFGDLVEQGLGDPRLYYNVSHICHQRALAAIRGINGYARHNYFNYHYYQGMVPQDATILAIRTEHLETDWASVEKYLSREDHDYRQLNVTFPQYNPSRTITAGDSALSVTGMKNLCHALSHEIKVYINLLNRAVNLTPHQVDQSVKLLAKSCPVQVQRWTSKTANES